MSAYQQPPAYEATPDPMCPAQQNPGNQAPGYGYGKVQPAPPPGYPGAPVFQGQAGYSGQPQCYPGQQPVYQGQPPGYPTQQAQSTQSTNVVINAGLQTYGSPALFLGHNPTPTTCPYCSHGVVTTVDYEIGFGTWMWVLIFFGVGFAILVTWFFCCIPCCITSMKDARHTCPNCNHTIGYHKCM